MTRFEEVLLERMTVRRWCVAVAAVAIGFGAAGYVGGREHVKHQIRVGVREAVAEVEAAGRKLSDDINRKQRAIDEQLKRKLAEQKRGGGR